MLSFVSLYCALIHYSVSGNDKFAVRYALNGNTGGSLTPGERDALVGGLNAGTQTRPTRLRTVVENQEFSRRHYNRAFVLMQYFWVSSTQPRTRRSPACFAGYTFLAGEAESIWRQLYKREMVKAFITSSEYNNGLGPDFGCLWRTGDYFAFLRCRFF